MIGLLVKRQLAEVFKSYFYDAKRNRMRSKATVAAWFALFAVIVVGLLGGMFATLSLTLCDGLVGAGAGWLYFAIMAGLAVLMGVFGAVFNSYAALFLAKDNDLLLSLPIPARDILASRLVRVYLLGTLYCSTAMVPALVVYWGVARPDVAAAVCGIAHLVIVSAIVLCLGFLLGWLVAKVSLQLKNKSLVTVAITVAFVALYYVAYCRASEAVTDLLANAALYGDGVKGAAYGIYLFGSVGEGNVPAAALFLGISAIGLALMWIVFSRSYLSIVTATGKTGHARYIDKPVKQRTQFGALASKELARFVSSPSYMLNSGLGILFLLAAGVAVLLNAQVLREMVAEVWGGDPGEACIVLGGALCLLAASNDMAAPSVSLEGTGIWVLQSLPVASRKVLRAKAAVHFILTAAPLAFATACIASVVDAPALPKALMCIVPFAFAAFSATSAACLGVRMANLVWTNEVIPIKQGGAATITLFGGWIVAIAFIALYFVIGSGMGPTAYLAVCATLFTVAALCLLRWLDTKGSRLFEGL